MGTDSTPKALGDAKPVSLFERLVHPWRGSGPTQFSELTSRVSKTAETAERTSQETVRLQKLLYREHEAIRALDERVSRQLEKLTRGTSGALEGIHRSMEQQAGVLGRLLQRFERVDELELQEARVLRRIDKIGRSSKPILVGPWTGEVGFELLYWIPFVHWAVDRMGVDPDRLVVMSRGGTAAWYGGLAGRYVDLFEHVSPEEFREATRPQLKQRRVSGLDLRLIRFVRQSGIPHVELLHPSLMYDLFYPVWKQIATVARITDHSRYVKPLEPSALPEAIRQRLPDRFVAVRFYYSQCFPQSDQNRDMASAIVQELSRQVPVVLLGPGARPDDHDDWEPRAGSDIISFGNETPPERNLEIQTAILARSQGFVGTYGGFAYLAPLYGVPAVTLYSQRTFYVHHLELVDALLGPGGGGRLCLVDVSTAGFAAKVLAGLA